MPEKNLQTLIKEILEPAEASESGFTEDPAAALQKHGFHLHPSYMKLMTQLREGQKENAAKVFKEIAEANPEQLRELYRSWAEEYQVLFGWEGQQGDDRRGWCL